jgi:hypothetical protein
MVSLTAIRKTQSAGKLVFVTLLLCFCELLYVAAREAKRLIDGFGFSD